MSAPSTEELIELLVDGARYGVADDVQRALEAKVDVNAQDEWGKTGAAAALGSSQQPAAGSRSALQAAPQGAVGVGSCAHGLRPWIAPAAARLLPFCLPPAA